MPRQGSDGPRPVVCDTAALPLDRWHDATRGDGSGTLRFVYAFAVDSLDEVR